MEKNKAGNIVKALNVIWLFSLLIGLNSCKKDHNTDIKNSSDQVFSGTYSNAYDKWRLIAIENGFRKKEKAPDFDYLKFTQPATYEIIKNDISVEKGTISKDITNSTDDLLIATFMPDAPSSPKYINPGNRYFILKSDTLFIFSTLDTSYSYRFVRLGKWVPKSAFLGGEEIVGKKLKETGSVHWKNQNMDVKNEYRFTALPGGYLDLNSQIPGFKNIGIEGHFWESTGNRKWYMMAAASNIYHPIYYYKTDGYSIRCIRD